MKKKALCLLLFLVSISLFSSTNKEVENSITSMGSDEGFLWNTGSFLELDSSSDVKDGKSLENSIVYIEKVLPGNKTVHRMTFTIRESRRISVTVSSRTGAKITLVDRMTGVLSTSGIVKETDGRIDIDLDKGEYQLKVENLIDDSPTVKVLGFYDINNKNEQDFFLNSSQGEYLSLSLKDGEQRSFWIKADKDNPVIFEALGRNLDHLSVWKDGKWKVETVYNVIKREVEKGKPLNFIEYNNILPEGFYLFKISGGQENSWSQGGDGFNPLYVRTDPESFHSGELRTVKISPFGSDALFFNGANLFIASPGKKSTIYLKTSDYSNGRSRYNITKSKKLSYDSYDDLCILEDRYRSGKGNIIIEGEPGTVVKLGTFISGNYDSLQLNEEEGTKRYWFNGFIPTGGADSVDLIPILHDSGKKLIRSGFITLNQDKPLVRLYNLNKRVKYFIHVEKTGSYVVEELGDLTNAIALYSFKNFRDYNEGGQEDQFEPGETIRLKEGYYIFTVDPIKHGIHNFVLFSKPFSALTEKALVKAAEKLNRKNSGSKLSSFNWPDVTLRHVSSINGVRGSNFNLEFNTDNNKVLDIRELPIDISKDFIPLVLSPGESVKLEIEVGLDSEIYVYGDNYKVTDISGKVVSDLTPGIQKLNLTNIGNGRELYSVGTRSLKIPDNIKAPDNNSISDILPELIPGIPVFNNFSRDQTISYLLTVQKSALYRLETTGRLRTMVKIRTPNITSLYSGSENGIGRNGLINTFLKPGEYLIEVTTLGESKGRGGIVLKENRLIFGNELGAGDSHRAVVDKGSALRFPISILDKGKYEFSTLLFNSSSKLRLEDTNGWPIYISSSGISRFTEELEPGDYIYYSLPGNSKSRRVTSINKITGISEGIMPLNGSITGLWMENSDRMPDIYSFSFSTSHSGYVYIPTGFEAWISDYQDNIVVKSVGELISFDLEQGSYSLNIRTVEVDNKKDYEVRVSTTELAEDNIKSVSLPGTYKVSIGSDSVVDIWSFGSSEIEAYLYRGDELLEYNNDAPGDWNFFISKKLEKGIYRLVLKGSNRGISKILIRERKNTTPRKIVLPFAEDALIGSDVLTYDLQLKKSINPLNISVKSEKDVFIYLYKGGEKIASGVNSLAIPVGGEGYSVQIIQRGNRPVMVHVSVDIPDSTHLDFGFSGTVTTKAVILKNSDRLNYYIEGDNILYSSGADRVMTPLSDLSITTKDGLGYIMSNTDSIGDITLTALELKPDNGETVTLYMDQVGFTLNNPENSITLVQGISPGTTLGMALNSRGFNWDQAWVSDSKSLFAVIPGGEFKGFLWNGGDSRTKAGLISKVFPVSEELTITSNNTFSMDKGTAKLFNIDSGGFTVVASRGIVASLWNKSKNQLIKTYYGNLDDSIFIIPSGAYSLGVVNPENNGGLINFQKDGGSGIEHIINEKSEYENYFTDPGMEIFQVGVGNKNDNIHIAGNTETVRVYDNNGSYSDMSGLDFITTLNISSGRIEIIHKGGLLKVWSGGVDTRDYDFCTNGNKLSRKAINPGVNILKRNFHSWELDIKNPVFISLKTISGGITSILKDGKLLEFVTGMYPRGRSLNYYLKEGSYQIVSRAISGGSQSGELYLSETEPVVLKEGGLDRELFIKKGESHIYTFSVVKAGKVGIGIKTNKDYLKTSIYDSGFNLIKSGSLSFIDLEKGVYFMVVESDMDTVRYQPVVYGLNGSVQEIPQDVIERYR